MNRKIHRWLTTVGMFFIPWMLISGTILATAILIDPSQEPDFIRPGPPLPPPLDITRLGQHVATAIKRAESSGLTKDARSLAVVIELHDKTATAYLVVDAKEEVRQNLKLHTGIMKQDPPKPGFLAAPLGIVVLAFHSGLIFGTLGQLLVLITSVGMLVLTVTGILMYVDMYVRRKKGSVPKLFWK